LQPEDVKMSNVPHMLCLGCGDYKDLMVLCEESKVPFCSEECHRKTWSHEESKSCSMHVEHKRERYLTCDFRVRNDVLKRKYDVDYIRICVVNKP